MCLCSQFFLPSEEGEGSGKPVFWVVAGCTPQPLVLGQHHALAQALTHPSPFPPLTPQLQVAELFYRQISLPFLNIFENTALYKFFSCSCCSCLE